MHESTTFPRQWAWRGVACYFVLRTFPCMLRGGSVWLGRKPTRRIISRACSCYRVVNMNQGGKETIIETIKTYDNNIRIINSDQSKITLRTKIDRDMDTTAKTWIKNFSTATRTEWIVNKTYPKIQRLQYRKDWVCQHNAKNKERKTSSARDRNRNCDAKIWIKVKNVNKFSRSRDSLLKEGLNAVIQVSCVFMWICN